MRELCRIQTFPDDVVIQGARGAIQKQVGNAVPSLLAEVLAEQIKTQFLGRRRGTAALLRLLPPRRTDVPAAEAVAAVPSEYLELRGEHEAHPGTGRGYGATAAQ
jgi:DNA (cytosine-5)-methyltransferase 1